MRKMVVLDAGNGKFLPRGITNGIRKNSPPLAVAWETRKLLEEEGVLVRSSSSILRSENTLHPVERAKRLGDYSKSKRTINLVVGTALFSSKNPAASGLVVCYGNAAAEAEALYKHIVAVARDRGYNMSGNRDKPYAFREPLEIIKPEILMQLGTGPLITTTQRDVGHVLDSYGKGRLGLDNALAELRNALEKSTIISLERAGGIVRLARRRLTELSDGAFLHIEGVKAFLVSLGFKTNAHDVKLLQDKKAQKALAEGMADGIKAILHPFE